MEKWSDDKPHFKIEIPQLTDNVNIDYYNLLYSDYPSKRKNIIVEDNLPIKRNKTFIKEEKDIHFFSEIDMGGYNLKIAPKVDQDESDFSLENFEGIVNKEYEEICKKTPFITSKLSFQEKKLKFPTSCTCENWKKNRYNDILCDEDTRFKFSTNSISSFFSLPGLSLFSPKVKSFSLFKTEGLNLTNNLVEVKKEEPQKYINANYINGTQTYHSYYIATQAPLENTIVDFYDMVWESNSKVLISLCSLVENNITKSFQFWPELDQPLNFAHFCVSLKQKFIYFDKNNSEKNNQQSNNENTGIIVRKIRLFNFKFNSTREIVQIHFTSWPDSGVCNLQSVVDIYNLQKMFEEEGKRENLTGPTIVNCSAGIGRTSTYISFVFAVQTFLHYRFNDDRAFLSSVVSVPDIVLHVRSQRSGSIQNSSQYSFVYKSLNYYCNTCK